MKFLEVYRGWSIFEIPDGYITKTHTSGEPLGAITRYIAIKETASIDDVTLGSLKAGIDEAEIHH